ncbi:MAG: hypothetical protein JW763_01185 [candidate division Zixibacteria bacterium]|nr:hypothetical protein [candidate division Zixibacteria bacterium]
MSGSAFHKNTTGRSYLWLIAAAVLLVVSNGRWIAPVAAWLAPLFLIRFLRSRRPLSGIVIGAVGYVAASMVMWLRMLMTGGWDWFSVLFVGAMGVVMFLPFVLDRLIAPRHHGFVSTLVFPLAWTTMEYIVSLVSPFATYSNLAYTQYGNLPLMQLASITGIWGIAFLVTWFASTANYVWEGEFHIARIRQALYIYGGILAIVLLYGGVRISYFAPAGKTVRIAGILRSDGYRDEMSTAEYLRDKQAVGFAERDRLLAQSRRAAQLGANVVIWQETAVSLIYEEEAFLAPGYEVAREEGIYLGMTYYTVSRNADGEPADRGEAVTLPDNKFVMIDPNGEIVWEYHKAHPLFGEHIEPGDGVIPFVATPFGIIAPVICFDLDVPDYIGKVGRHGGDILLAPSFDWRQITPLNTHAAVFRAVENGCALVRCTAHGLSVGVDCQGRVRGALDSFTTDERVMICDVPVDGVGTLYPHIRDLFAWIMAVGFVLIAVMSLIVRPRR